MQKALLEKQKALLASLHSGVLADVVQHLSQAHGKLSLRSQKLSALAVATLADALRQNATLTALDMFQCGLGPESAASMILALTESKNATVVSLDLSFNEWSLSDSFKSMADAIAQNNSLTKLNLFCNKFAQEEIVLAIECNTKLVEVDISPNDCKKSVFDRIRAACKVLFFIAP